MQNTPYKYNEINQYFLDFLSEQDAEWVKDNIDDLHYHVFRADYFIIGRHRAVEWLGDQVFNVINIIKDYENKNFGKVETDLSSPENVVNMYVSIIGEQVVYDNENSFITEKYLIS